MPSKKQAFNRLLCLLYLLLYKDYRRHGIYGEIRSGTWCDGVQRFEFQCECLASGPTAWEERTGSVFAQNMREISWRLEKAPL